MTNARPRLNHQANSRAGTRSAYGPAVRKPTREGGSGTSHARTAVAARIPAGAHAGRRAVSSSGSSAGFKAIRPEADIAQSPPLGALAHVLGELLGVERLGGAVLPLHAGHRQGLAVGGGHR